MTAYVKGRGELRAQPATGRQPPPDSREDCPAGSNQTTTPEG